MPKASAAINFEAHLEKGRYSCKEANKWSKASEIAMWNSGHIISDLEATRIHVLHVLTTYKRT